MIRQHAVPAICLIGGAYLASDVVSPLSFHAGSLLMLIACLLLMKRLGHP